MVVTGLVVAGSGLAVYGRQCGRDGCPNRTPATLMVSGYTLFAAGLGVFAGASVLAKGARLYREGSTGWHRHYALSKAQFGFVVVTSIGASAMNAGGLAALGRPSFPIVMGVTGATLGIGLVGLITTSVLRRRADCCGRSPIVLDGLTVRF